MVSQGFLSPSNFSTKRLLSLRDQPKFLQICFCLLMCTTSSSAFYVPGTAPITYQSTCYNSYENCHSDQLMIYVNRLNSLRNILPYNFYDFDFCEPPVGIDMKAKENLGQLLMGDRIRPSKYIFDFAQSPECVKVCRKSYNTNDKESMKKLSFLKQAIRNEYNHHWTMDDITVVQCYTTSSDDKYCTRSFPVGCYVKDKNNIQGACNILASIKANDTYYLFNHLDFHVEYHASENVPAELLSGRVIRITVTPRSIDHQSEKPEACFLDTDSPPLAIPGGKLNSSLSFYYSYSVYWKKTDILWSHRWDFLIEMSQTDVAWFSIANSGIVLLFLSLMLIIGFRRKVSKDLSSYKEVYSMQERKGMGWTLIEGDVFRFPKSVGKLAVLASSGFQLLLASFITMVFGSAGVLSQANPGALITCFMIMFLLSSLPAGYVSARIYKGLGGEKFKTNALCTIFFCPGVCFGLIFLLNCIMYNQGSSATLPPMILVLFPICWFSASIPLTFLGAFFGNRKQAVQFPLGVNEKCRPIPRSVCTSSLCQFLAAGVLPFGSLFIQVYFILTSLWLSTAFSMFPHLLLSCLALIVTTCETGIILCFIQLNSENYHWWWRSFMNGGSMAMYFFLYCIQYCFVKMHLSDPVDLALYFGYTVILCFLLFLATGCIGFFSCFWLVRVIYKCLGAVK